MQTTFANYKKALFGISFIIIIIIMISGQLYCPKNVLYYAQAKKKKKVTVWIEFSCVSE